MNFAVYSTIEWDLKLQQSKFLWLNFRLEKRIEHLIAVTSTHNETMKDKIKKEIQRLYIYQDFCVHNIRKHQKIFEHT